VFRVKFGKSNINTENNEPLQEREKIGGLGSGGIFSAKVNITIYPDNIKTF